MSALGQLGSGSSVLSMAYEPGGTTVVSQTVPASCFNAAHSLVSSQCLLYILSPIGNFAFSVLSQISTRLGNRTRVQFFHWSVCISFTATSVAEVILDWAFLVFSPTPVPGKFVSWLL